MSFLGCEDDDRKYATQTTEGATTEHNTSSTSSNTTSSQTTSSSTSCSGSGLCAPSCGGDFFGSATCQNGQWVCDDPNWVLIDDCPAGSCFGSPLAAETCDNGWVCDLEANRFVLDSCFEGLVCASCEGVEEAIVTESCGCICTPTSQVECRSSFCEVSSTSTLPNARLTLSTQPCAWTTDRLARQIRMAYTIEVDEDIDIIRQDTNAESCFLTNSAGFHIFETVSGNDQEYAPWRDLGLCGNADVGALQLTAGTFEDAMVWSGRNWQGESDTGNPLGAEFPPGSYTLEVRNSGVYRTASGEEAPYTMSSQVVVHISP